MNKVSIVPLKEDEGVTAIVPINVVPFVLLKPPEIILEHEVTLCLSLGTGEICQTVAFWFDELKVNARKYHLFLSKIIPL